MKLLSGGQDTSRQTCGVIKIGVTGEGNRGGGGGWTHSGLELCGDMRSEQRHRKTGAGGRGGVRSGEKERPLLSSAPLSILTPVQGRGPRACENGTWKQPPWPSARWAGHNTRDRAARPAGRAERYRATHRLQVAGGAESGAQRECHPWVLGAQGRPHKRGMGTQNCPCFSVTRSRPRVPRESIWLAEPRPRRPPLSAGV